MPVNSDGYIGIFNIYYCCFKLNLFKSVPSILMIKILPMLEEGIQFVGFIKESDPCYAYPYFYEDDQAIQHFIIYKVDDIGNSNTIVGITQSLNQFFGIPTTLVD